jgi:hypothetical protein
MKDKTTAVERECSNARKNESLLYYASAADLPGAKIVDSEWLSLDDGCYHKRKLPAAQ